VNFIKNFVLVFLILFTAMAVNVNALDCPIGLINDTAPGSCALYIDKNTDALCDLSQPELNDSCDTNITATDLTSTEIKAMTVEQVAEYYKIEGQKFAEEISKIAGTKVKTSDSFQILHDNYEVRPLNVREIAVAMSFDSKIVVSEKTSDTHNDTSKNLYPIFAIVIGTHLLYLLTFILSKKEIISTNVHRKIWNWLLLIAFIPVMITSLLWLLRVEYNFIVPTFFNVVYWHVVFGLIMIIISAFHILWHIKYYFTVKNKNTKEK